MGDALGPAFPPSGRRPRVLLIDGAAAEAELFRAIPGPRFLVRRAADSESACRLAAGEPFDVILADLRSGGGDGIAAVRAVRRLLPDVPVVVLAPCGDAAAAPPAGADEVLRGPVGKERLTRVLHRFLPGPGAQPNDPPEPWGQSPAFRAVLEQARAAAASEGTVLITGETGSGKEVIARYIHRLSARRRGPFAAVNCAAIPEPLIESELFGHERGAFTGAVRRRKGRLEEAAGGVVLLDEIGELSPALQSKLLRVLEVKRISRLGSNEEIPVDVRFVAATSRDLRREIACGRFRADLFYRLNVLPIHVPPLRERRGDVPLLLNRFLDRYAAEAGRRMAFDPEALRRLERHPFPGNVRELANLVHRLVLSVAGETIRVGDLPEEYRRPEPASPAPPALAWAEGMSLAEALRAVERELIVNALRRHEGHRGKTARALGISRKNLWEKMRAHGLAGRRVWDGDGPDPAVAPAGIAADPCDRCEATNPHECRGAGAPKPPARSGSHVR
ncbi:MAG: sigma-54-dependent Fis family transcriptional regulator [Acidobacteria bacterium]|nr:MAG: sigma-54-dependent Fis family transcriptional regulator [Acidobacteriota bacterium]